MKASKIAAIILLVCLAILLYIFLPGEEKENFEQPVLFNRTVKFVAPPARFLQKGTGDRLERLLDRLEWGTSEVVNKTIDDLIDVGGVFVTSEAIKRISRYRRARPSLAKDYIDLLAELKAPEGLPVLLECAGDPSEMIRRAAINGLSGYMERESTGAMVELARTAEERIRLLCLETLASRTSPEILSLYRELIADEKDLRSTIFAVEGLGKYDTAVARELIDSCLADSRLDVRTAALRALLNLDDPRAGSLLEEMLVHAGPIRRINGARLLTESRQLPSIDVLGKLARDDVPEVRIYLTMAMLIHLENDTGDLLQKVRTTLYVLLDDPRPDVRLKVLEGLFKAGDESVALPYLQKIPKAKGAELAEAVEIVSRLLKHPRAASLLVERFEGDGGLSGDERLSILSGLAELEASDGIGLFFRVIRGEWNSRNIAIGEFTLDHHAAFKVHAFGEGVFESWLEFLDDDDGNEAAYLFVNGVRNLGDPRAADMLLDLAGDSGKPRWIREEAVKTFAFLEDKALGARLLEFRENCRDRELADLASMIFWNYF